MMAGGNGRWITASCETTLCYQTCRNSSNFYQVSLSQAAAHWNATNTVGTVLVVVYCMPVLLYGHKYCMPVVFTSYVWPQI